MARKDITVEMKDGPFASHEMIQFAAVQMGFGIDDHNLMDHKLDELRKLLWFPPDVTEEAMMLKILHALELYEGLKPSEAAEGMLAMQMVGTHDAALACLKRAAVPNQTFKARDMALKHAQKLMTLYTQQLAALNKHRGKGQQKVTVEHVNVQAGGQAIVGNVDTTASVPPQAPPTEAIEHAPHVPLEAALKSKTQTKVK